MSEKTGSAKPKPGYYETPAANPDGCGTVTVRVALERGEHLAKYGPTYRLHELTGLVRETLVDPDRIYPYRDDDYDGFCYAKKASYRVRNSGSRDDPPRGEVFTVFVDRLMRVADWGWEQSDANDELLPAVHVNRLEEPSWSKTK